MGTQLAGGRPYYLPITAENGFLPDLKSVKSFILKNTRLLWINYPNNPTGAVAGLDFFQQVVEFAGQNDILVCHDGPYSEGAFDGYQPVSFMQAEGAKDIGVGFHSLSKAHHTTGGWQRRGGTLPKASLYIWAKVPAGYNSVDFTADLLDQIGVAVTPGVGYGQSGEGYVRLSLTIPDVSMVKGISRLSS